MKGVFTSVFSLMTIAFCLVCAWAYLEMGHEGSFFLVNQWFSPAWAWFFFGVTQIGDGLFVVVLCLVMAFWSARNAFVVLVSYLFSSLISRILKDLVFVEYYRPNKYFGDLGITFNHLESLELYSFHSFPSGHTITAFAVFGILAFMFPSNTKQMVFALIAILVAISRVYLAQHFVRDVMVGAVLGFLSTSILWLVLNNKKISEWMVNKLEFDLKSFFYQKLGKS